MTVFVLFSVDSHGNGVLVHGAYSSRDLARVERQALNSLWRERQFTIHEFELDAIPSDWTLKSEQPGINDPDPDDDPDPKVDPCSFCPHDLTDHAGDGCDFCGCSYPL